MVIPLPPHAETTPAPGTLRRQPWAAMGSRAQPAPGSKWCLPSLHPSHSPHFPDYLWNEERCYHGLRARREGMRKGREEGGKRGGNKDSIVISSKKLQTLGQGRMRGWGCGLPPHLCLTSGKSQQLGKKTPHSKAQPAPAPKPSA